MKSRSQWTIIGLTCMALLAWTSAPATRTARASAIQQATNLLDNPDFEGGFVIQCSYPGGRPWITLPCDSLLPSMPWQTVRVAKGWAAWWRPPSTDRSAPDYYQNAPNYCGRDAPDGCVAWHNPEYDETRNAPQDPPRIHLGENSQKYFTFWSVHEGGVYQSVSGIRPGTTLRFSVYMEVWSATKLSGSEPNPHFSFGQTNMHLRVGIDPTGGTDPWSKDIVWSDEHESYDQFTLFEVQAVAQSNKVTVFTHSRPENPLEHNDVYVDDAALIAVSGGGPSAPPVVNPPPAVVAIGAQPTAQPGMGGRIVHVVKPGDTLFALALQYGVPVDQILALNNLTADSQIAIGSELIIALPAPKPLSRPTGSNPVVSVSGSGSGLGTVCVQSFEDADTDGLRAANEPLLNTPGTHFILSDGQGHPIDDLILNDPSAAHCFADLPATTYRVMADPPHGYLATGQQRWAVSLTSDVTVDVQFGVKPDPNADQTPVLPGLMLGAGLTLLAVAVLGVAVWKRRSQ